MDKPVINPKAEQSPDSSKLTLWSLMAVSGVVIYLVIDILLAFLRPDYNLLHNAESDYGRGPYFWLMDLNFILRCLLSLALVKALVTKFPKNKAIKQASYWLILWALLSGLLAFFADNPSGYSKLPSGSAHLLIALLDFIAALCAMVSISRLASVMNLSRKISHCLFILCLIATMSFILMGRSGFHSDNLGGLYERIFLGSVLLWEVIVALSIRSRRNISNKQAH